MVAAARTPALLALLLGATPALAHTPVAGALDRPDVIHASYLGESAQIKAAGSVDYNFLYAGIPQATWDHACTQPCPDEASAYYISNTLVPPFAYAYVWKSPTWIGATLYSPDQVKRTANAKQTKVGLKQKAYVGLVFANKVTTSVYTFDSFRIKSCKGKADVRTTATAQTGRLLVKCSAKELEQALEGAGILEDWNDFMDLIGLKKPSFDWRAEVAVP